MKDIRNAQSIVTPLGDGALIHTLDKKGRTFTKLRLGPNHVHAFITRKDGTIEDLGISTNLLTNTGRDLWAAAFGHAAMSNAANSTGATATGLSGLSGLTSDQYKGWRVFVPITGVT